MKNNSSIVYALFLALGDFATLAFSFVLSYAWLFKLEDRPNLQLINFRDYSVTVLAVLPVWITVHALIGLYSRSVYENRFRETGRLFVGSFIGILLIISYDYLSDEVLFPGRMIILASLGVGLLLLLIFRGLARLIRSILFHYGVGVNNVLIVGGGTSTNSLIAELEDTRHSGHRIVGVVGETGKKFPAFQTFEEAINSLKKYQLHSIIQTDLYKKGEMNTEIMAYAQEHHVSYRFIPGNNELFVGNIEVELFRGTPVVTVHQTALIGWGSVLKRLFDVLVSSILLILLSPIFVIIAIVQKILEPRGRIFFKQERLTRFDQSFYVYKFRTAKTKYNGLTPEEAFEKMGKPELGKTYRAQGDFLQNDPRYGHFASFLRVTSLDELPQLFNVFRGDISLVGPRALVPEELKNYRHKHHILSVKSGITGLAQVSGRRDLNFEERRKLDTYYVQNWSFWLDITILLRTLRAVINGIGAK